MAGVRGLVTLVPLSHGVPAPELAVEERPADKSKALCDTLVPAKLAVIEAAASCCTSLQASGERGRVLGARCLEAWVAGGLTSSLVTVASVVLPLTARCCIRMSSICAAVAVSEEGRIGGPGPHTLRRQEDNCCTEQAQRPLGTGVQGRPGGGTGPAREEAFVRVRVGLEAANANGTRAPRTPAALGACPSRSLRPAFARRQSHIQAHSTITKRRAQVLETLDSAAIADNC